MGARQWPIQKLVWKMLEESEVSVMDATELKTERWARLPYPSEATGVLFDEAAQKIGGVMRVLWDWKKIYVTTSMIQFQC